MIIHVTDQTGKTHDLEAPEGWRLMEVIRDYGLPIKAECGGSCACATCHVYIDENWYPKLPTKTEDEDSMLDEAFHLKPTSRLSCQIILDESMDGLKMVMSD